jgi:hypothetical protein
VQNLLVKNARQRPLTSLPWCDTWPLAYAHSRTTLLLHCPPHPSPRSRSQFLTPLAILPQPLRTHQSRRRVDSGGIESYVAKHSELVTELVGNGSGDAELAIGLGVAVFDDAPEQLWRQYPHACSASQPRVLAPASAPHHRSWLRKKYCAEGGKQKENTAPKGKREGFPSGDPRAGTRPCRTQGTHIMTARVRG